MKKFIKNSFALVVFLFCFTLSLSAQSNKSVKAIHIPNPPTLEQKQVQSVNVQAYQDRINALEAALQQENLSAELVEKYTFSINRLKEKIQTIKQK